MAETLTHWSTLDLQPWHLDVFWSGKVWVHCSKEREDWPIYTTEGPLMGESIHTKCTTSASSCVQWEATYREWDAVKSGVRKHGSIFDRAIPGNVSIIPTGGIAPSDPSIYPCNFLTESMSWGGTDEVPLSLATSFPELHNNSPHVLQGESSY